MPPTRGVVLETFGAGNAPQRADIMEALQEACDNNVVIVAITQCSKGSVSDAYETGRSLLQAGVVPGGDMTPEVSAMSLLSTTPANPPPTVCAHETELPPLQTRTHRRAGPSAHRYAPPWGAYPP